MTKQQLKKGAEEAQGYTVAGLKLLSMAIPLYAANQLGIPKITAPEAASIGLVLAAVSLGIFWLRHK